jgi:DNA processing protein
MPTAQRHEIIVPEDPRFPATLTTLARIPRVLHLAGSLDGLDRSVGIVGTRRATPDALALTEELAHDLAAAGWLVVSGGAEGIDRAAHDGALAHGSGRTLAVLPTPLDQPYPRSHRGLYERIATRGGCVTELASGAATHKGHFLERNRIIAALSRALVVVQAPEQSGALSTAIHARALGRPLLSVPWSPREPMGIGSNELLANGARICRNARDVLSALGAPTPRPVRRARAAPPPDPDERAVLDVVEAQAVDIDTVAARAGLSVPRAMAAVIRLVIDGRLVEDPHGIRRA